MGGPAQIDGKRCKSTDNFLEVPITIEGTVDGKPTPIEWSTCEHFFQAVKFDSEAGGKKTQQYLRAIQETPGAGGAWSMGQSRSHPLRRDWEQVKGHAMYLAVKAKYDQHPELAAELLATTGPIKANQSTSNWQMLNSVVLERVREELSVAAGRPRVSEGSQRERRLFETWMRLTSVPAGAPPLVVCFTEMAPRYERETAAGFMCCG